MKSWIRAMKSEDGVAMLLTLLVAAAISLIGLSLILITETDTKVAMSTQITKQNLNVGDGALKYGLNVLRKTPTLGYLDYPWEKLIPPINNDSDSAKRVPGGGTEVMAVRLNTDGDDYLDNGQMTTTDPASPSFASVDDATKQWVLLDHFTVSGSTAAVGVRNVPVYAPGAVEQTRYAYYTLYVEAVQGTGDWNTNPSGNGSPDGALDEYDFDKWQLQLRARVVGLYGSVKDLIMQVKVVKPDGSPYGDVPGSTQGGSSGPCPTTPCPPISFGGA